MSAIIDVEGIGAFICRETEGSRHPHDRGLAQRRSNPGRPKKIEKATGIGHKLILKWTNHVDLYRIKGVQKQYAELLEASGVDTVIELGKHDPAKLLPKMVATNAEKNLSVSCRRRNRLPTGSRKPRRCRE